MPGFLKSVTLVASTSALGAVTEFVRNGAREAGLPESRVGELELVIEEIFINVCRYSYPGGAPGNATISYSVPAPGQLRVEVDDQGVEFNPLDASPPDLVSECRGVGGLGIFLVKSFVDSLTYRREEGWNHLTFGISAER